MAKQRKAADDPFKRLARLPRRADLSVLGGKRPLGLYLQEGSETFQPELTIWLDGQNGMILGSEAINPQTSKDSGVSEALESLAAALIHPQPIPFLPALLSGMTPSPGSLAAPPKPRPGLPAKILINDAALAEAARALFEPLQVPVEYQAESAAFDQAFQSLSRHLGAKEGAQPPEPFAWELAQELLTPLYAAAESLWQRAPWEYMLDHPPLEITLGAYGPQSDVPKLYASILGANGEVYGVACYTSLEAFERTLRRGEELISANPNIDAAIEALRQAGAPLEGLEPEELRMVVGELLMEQEGLSESQAQELTEDALVCFFNLKEECDSTYLDWMKTRSLNVPEEDGVPFFIRTNVGQSPRQPEKREVRALTLALEALGQFFNRFGEDLDEGAEPDVPLTLVAQARLGKERVAVPVSFTPTEEMYADDEDLWLDEEIEEPDEPPSEAATTTLYRFQVKLEWMPDVWRRIEMTGDQTLHDLHHVIQEAFDWDNDHLYAFFLSGKPWDRATEYDSPHGEGERSAAKTRLEHLSLKPGKQFLYLFDFGDELRHEIKLEAVLPGESEPDEEYPRITEVQGAAPPQYPDLEDDEDDEDEDEEEDDEDDEDEEEEEE